MSIMGEVHYAEGFIDGQIDVIESIMDIVNSADGRTEAYEEIMQYIQELEKEIDSL